MASAKFQVMLVKRGIPRPENVKLGDQMHLGIHVDWKCDPEVLKGYKRITGGKVKASTIDGDPDVLSIGDRQ